MKFLQKLHPHLNWSLLVLRLSIGAIFIFHGMQKWAMWSVEPSAQMSVNMLWLMRFLSVVEPLGGLALIVGVFTQLAALGLALVMVGAIFFKIAVFKMGFAGAKGTGWEFDLILLASCLHLFLSGAGRYALDACCPGKRSAGK